MPAIPAPRSTRPVDCKGRPCSPEWLAAGSASSYPDLLALSAAGEPGAPSRHGAILSKVARRWLLRLLLLPPSASGSLKLIGSQRNFQRGSNAAAAPAGGRLVRWSLLRQVRRGGACCAASGEGERLAEQRGGQGASNQSATQLAGGSGFRGRCAFPREPGCFPGRPPARCDRFSERVQRSPKEEEEIDAHEYAGRSPLPFCSSVAVPERNRARNSGDSEHPPRAANADSLIWFLLESNLVFFLVALNDSLLQKNKKIKSFLFYQP